MITIFLNGKEHTLDHPMSVSQLLESIGLGDKPCVVERNQQALFPREYDKTKVQNKDRLEIITIAAGG